MKKSKLSSGNSFALQRNACGKSLMETRKSGGPKIEPCGTSASARDHFDD